VAGFVLTILGLNPVTLRRQSAIDGPLPDLHTRTAILMPVYNEDVRRVFDGIAATFLSVRSTGRLPFFDFFVLSDSTDPDIWIAEEALWDDTCRRLDAAGRLFYRHRADNAGKKAGNIADWVRNHGGAYETMIVLDADSIMHGETIVRLVALAESNPRAGIVQTLAVPANRTTLFARWLQFATRLYGPLLAVGHSFWWVSEGNCFGHNAIFRTRAFAAHCGLPRLAGKPPLGGEVMSHDFVEAACMRRGGWHAWFVPDLPGSFEEVPSNIVDYAVRDRRWTQGNIQHARILFSRGFHWISRLHLAMGVLAYVASPLWLLLLVLSSIVVIQQAISGHVYFPAGHNLFPIWPEYRPLESGMLLAATAIVLLMPKVLSLVTTLASRRKRHDFGGGAKLLTSAAAEILLSMLLAPIMMLFHSKFVITILAGRSVGWTAQPRDDRGISWAEAARRHAGHGLVGVVWGGAILWYAPDFLWWMAPVVAGLAAAIPLTVYSSRTNIGLALRRGGLFLTPEELAPCQALQQLHASRRCAPGTLPGFLDVLKDRRLAALHMAILASRAPSGVPSPVVGHSPETLDPAERRALLGRPGALEARAAVPARNDPSIGRERQPS
jgi:membrane glycosyltransferase